MSSSFCTQCGKSLKSEDKFCAACGHQSEAMKPDGSKADSNSPSQKSVTVSKVKTTSSKVVKVIKITSIVLGIIAVLLVTLIFWWLSGDKTVSSPVPKDQSSKSSTLIKPPDMKKIEQQLTSNLKLPRILEMSARDNPVTQFGTTEISVAINNPDRIMYHLFWKTDCGIISPNPENSQKAIFIAPESIGHCTVTAEVKSQNMLNEQSIQISILVVSDDEGDI